VSKSINHVTLLGNLGNDPEVKHTTAGTPVARLSVATNSRFKDKSGNWTDRTDWHTVILWARLAEIAGEYLRKGSKLAIMGELRTRSWESKEKGKQFATEVIGSQLIMLDGKQATEKPTNEKESPITDEDIPF
jgi:single-strand DNA-binding protein